MKGSGLGKKSEPTVLIVDSQAVKNTDSSSNTIKGFCSYKSTNGIKRHLVTDVLGIPKFIKCTPANKTDDYGLIEVIKENQKYFLSLEYKMTILADNGYHKEKIESELKAINLKLLEKIEIKITPKPNPDPKDQGFIPAHKRWVIERANAWVEKCNSMHKNREKTLEACESKIKLCFIRVLTRRLGRESY